MKKLILTCIAYSITLSVYAQTDSLNQRMNTNDSRNNNLNEKINEDGTQDSSFTKTKPKNPDSDRFNNSIRQDSTHSVKPVQPGRASTPSMSTPSNKPVTPATIPNDKSTVKSSNDKNMYLVPDSSNKKIIDKK